jgi:hypothetical protein
MTKAQKERFMFRDPVKARDLPVSPPTGKAIHPRKGPKKQAESRPINFAETTLHDPARWPKGRDQAELRLYCTASPYTHGESWTLLLCAPVRTRRGKSGKRFAIGCASMSREDLIWLRDQINVELRRKS